MYYTKYSMFLFLAIEFLLLSSCSPDKQTETISFSFPLELSEVDSAVSDPIETVEITFIQCPFLGFSYDESGDVDGYYFKNETITTTRIDYENGYFLSQTEIEDIYKNKLDYRIPNLHGDGYWAFTLFVTNFDEESGLANVFLEPQELNKNMSVYYAIYG